MKTSYACYSSSVFFLMMYLMRGSALFKIYVCVVQSMFFPEHPFEYRSLILNTDRLITTFRFIYVYIFSCVIKLPLSGMCVKIGEDHYVSHAIV